MHGPSRWRRLWGVALPLLGAVALVLSMASVVRRGTEARRLSKEVEVLRRAEQITRDRLDQVARRADSLASRARIREVAGRLGLRPATDLEIVFLVDVAEAPSDEAPSEEVPAEEGSPTKGSP